VTPFSVYDLPYMLWCGYANANDQYVAEQNRRSSDG
jgi:hypothetical protein